MPKFVPNRHFAAQLERTREYQKGLAGKAEEAKAFARSFAPVGDSAPGEHYKDQIEVVVQGGKVYLVAKKFTSHWIEFGSIHNPPSAPLRRGARAAGLRFKEASK